VTDIGEDFPVLVGLTRTHLQGAAESEEVVLAVTFVQALQPDAQAVILVAAQILQSPETVGSARDQIQVAVLVESQRPENADLGWGLLDSEELEIERGSLTDHGQPRTTADREVRAAVIVRIKSAQCGEHRASAQLLPDVPRREATTPIAQEPHPLSGGYQVGVSIVVQIDADDGVHRRDPAQSAGLGTVGELALAQVVEPGQAVGMGKEQVHIAIAVQIAGNQVTGRSHLQLWECLVAYRFEGACERVEKELRRTTRAACRGQIQITFDVEVQDRCRGRTGASQAEFGATRFEGAVSQATEDPESVVAVADQIQVTVVVQISGQQAL